MKNRLKQPATEEKLVEETWDRIWGKEKIPEWDSLSQLILEVLKKEIGSPKNKKILEAGSGSGRISLRLAQEGAKVTLLDASPHAIKLSKKIFKKAKVPAKFLQASIFDMPFANESFDIVWNAGVLEHYNEREQQKILKEMLRICRKDGLIITLNPYRWAIFYRIGKWCLERSGKWTAGYERPIRSLKKMVDETRAKLTHEYSVGFLEQFTFLLANPKLKRFERRFLLIRDKCWKLNYLPGYLLVTILRKL